MKKHRAALSLAAFATLINGIAPLSSHAQTPTVITVDAGTPVRQSDSGDDLATLQNIFQGANLPGDNADEPLKPIITDLKMKRARLLLNDVYCDIDSQGNFGSQFAPNGQIGFVAGECNPLGWKINWALNNGLSPHVAVAATMPISFAHSDASAQETPAEKWSPAGLARYRITPGNSSPTSWRSRSTRPRRTAAPAR